MTFKCVEDVAEFAFKYGKRTPVEKDVIEFLYSRDDKAFIGNYTDLSRALGRDVKNCPNLRKIVLRLSRDRIVYLDRYETVAGASVIKGFYLVSDWMDKV